MIIQNIELIKRNPTTSNLSHLHISTYGAISSNSKKHQSSTVPIKLTTNTGKLTKLVEISKTISEKSMDGRLSPDYSLRIVQIQQIIQIIATMTNYHCHQTIFVIKGFSETFILL
ncbi:hypothetical protein WN51_00306 [Melipona quadrifasciata]|uniref:Uncharacterized protein n=1 Tax=Melipona quadrifasciata TaxID=166423 RepID=A0A0M9A250_9HYME|nr:hypothetical protein WN51_00306 [Melipona quadrifasciata]